MIKELLAHLSGGLFFACDMWGGSHWRPGSLFLTFLLALALAGGIPSPPT